MKKITLPLLSLFFFLCATVQLSAQIKETKSATTPTINLEKLVKHPGNDYVVTAEHTSTISGIHHMYLRQAINGLEVFGTESSLHRAANGKLIASHNNFVGDIQSTLVSATANLSAEQAIASVAQQMGYTLSNIERLKNYGGINQKSEFNTAGISATNIPVKLMYYYREGIGTTLVWEISVEEIASADWWNFRVDASTGTIIDKDNLTISCISEEFHSKHAHNSATKNTTNIVNESPVYFSVADEPSSVIIGSYNVIAMPLESPNHGSRTMVANPDNAIASPYGWHDTNGVSGAESQYTIGNNVDAYDDTSSTISGQGSGVNSERAFGGPTLNFNYPFNPDVTVGDGSIDAAVTNLFYWNNIIHDVTYQYGFNPASGNFQLNTYGNGGIGNDSVRGEAQDGSGTCNANFATPTDGNRPRMQMYVCNSRDGDFDNGVVVHEYGHGISTRLTGGAGTSSCLNNQEQMGEGWSDFYGLMLTMEPGDQGTDVRGIGTWLVGEGAGGPGIRTYPYSTNFGANPLTYADINAEAIPHGTGSVWATMLWEMTWELIGEHGYSPDLYTFTGNVNTDAGNIMALALVTEGLKLQPCSPGFIDGRNAILQADTNIYGGANHCAIWRAFARRGLGSSASQGSTNNVDDGAQAFDLPSNIAGFENSIDSACLNGGVLTGLTGGFPAGGTYAGPGVSNTGGNTYSFNPLTAGIGSHNITYTVNDFCNSNSSTVFTEVINVQDDTLALICPADIIAESDSSSVCSAQVVYAYPNPSGDLCNRTPTDVSQNTNPTINSGLDCTDTASGHLRRFNLSTLGVTRDYTIDGIDVGINNNAAGIANITVNIYINSQLNGTPITSLAVPLSVGITPYASVSSIVPAGSGFTHTVPMNVFLPAGTIFIVEVLSPSSRNNLIAYNSAGSGNPANETAVGYLNCVGGNYIAPSAAGYGYLAVLIEVSGQESNEYTTTQTAGLATGSVFSAGTTTNTFMTSRMSGGSSSCSFDVTVIGKTTIYSGGVWSPVSPGAGSNARFSQNYNTSSGDITACSCEIDGGRTVTVAAGDFLDIYGTITVNGNLVVEHTGSVRQTDGLAPVNNNSNGIDVELTTPVLQTRDFMVMGSPMTAETRNGVFTNAFLVLNHTPGNFIPHPAVPAGGTNFADDDGNFWNAYGGGINVGEGYIVRPQSGYTDPANTTYDMTYSLGTLNNGDVVRPVIFNGLGTNPDGTPNVFSNPYPSAISASQFISANPLVTRVYFWEHLTPPLPSTPGAGSINFSMDDISMYIDGGALPAASDPGTSTTPNGVISTGQGFGIKAFGAGNVTFTNSMRLTTGNTTLRTPLEIESILLKVRNEQYNIGSHALVAFNPLATPNLDPNYDADRLATTISLYSHLEDGSEQLGIQSREVFDSSIKVSMGFASQVDADTAFTISIANLEGAAISNATVYLIDNQENSIHNLSDGNYEFRSAKGTFNQRFTLLFEWEEILGNQDALLDNIALYPNPTTNILHIFSPQMQVESVVVYDVQGRKVQEKSFTSQGQYQIDMSILDSALYFVKVKTENGSVTKRIIKE
ncbi:putative secreted protein (Por secretion system target) [Ulvibacter sp. MAR_2010_11]|uniref:M36 family metallopeptidase n=1 Tax=Ulvibacter sp. MAR_2010_11 TaxID=1250229 RepID=UPI000C2C164D|nr:M36 family metallopeptidase [Ulvibacter sp. MAR_2010_11]PKA82304.1 putative secreted protein (Por secretion system target) [Ulvibacter sp. MAR_2010_11]